LAHQGHSLGIGTPGAQPGYWHTRGTAWVLAHQGTAWVLAHQGTAWVWAHKQRRCLAIRITRYLYVSVVDYPAGVLSWHFHTGEVVRV
jgi:hypothetical protein